MGVRKPDVDHPAAALSRAMGQAARTRWNLAGEQGAMTDDAIDRVTHQPTRCGMPELPGRLQRGTERMMCPWQPSAVRTTNYGLSLGARPRKPSHTALRGTGGTRKLSARSGMSGLDPSRRCCRRCRANRDAVRNYPDRHDRHRALRVGDPEVRVPGVSSRCVAAGGPVARLLAARAGDASAGLYCGDAGGAGMDVLRSVRARWPRPRGVPGPDAAGPALSWIGDERIAISSVPRWPGRWHAWLSRA